MKMNHMDDYASNLVTKCIENNIYDTKTYVNYG